MIGRREAGSVIKASEFQSEHAYYLNPPSLILMIDLFHHVGLGIFQWPDGRWMGNMHHASRGRDGLGFLTTHPQTPRLSTVSTTLLF